MSMFDYLNCKYPLPVEGANAIEYQTKDTEAQSCDLYEIREDGSIWYENYDIEDHGDPDAVGLARLYGSMTKTNKRWIPYPFTGNIVFYSSRPFHGEFIEFMANFVNGQLTSISQRPTL